MRGWLTLSTIAALLVHLALGCCAHHAHAAQAPCVHRQHGEPHDHAHAHGHDHAAAETPASPAPTDPSHHECGHASCVFLPTGKVIFDDGDSPGQPLVFAGQPLARQATTATTGFHRPAIRAPAAVRPHLLHQVFLI